MTDIFAKFSAALAGFNLPQNPRLAVGVSGGGDSMALCLLLKEWCDKNGGEVLALTVDHGLRAESVAEAEQVAATLKSFNIPHQILRWTGDKPSTHLQERARQARYDLLVDACLENNFPVLTVAHNLEDQIETFWMRLKDGSGLDGLAGMAKDRDIDGIRLIRPLLGFTREELRQYCSDRNCDVIDDPSNTNEKFLRVRLRQFEDMLAQEGLSPQRLSATLQKLEEARAALETVTEAALQSAVQLKPEGYIVLQLPLFMALHADIQRRCLLRLLPLVAPQDYPPGTDAVDQLRQGILNPDFRGRTLAGVEVFPSQGGIVFAREAAAMAPPINAKTGAFWDGRFMVSGDIPESVTLGALGETGLAYLRKQEAKNTALLARLEALPHPVRRGLPTLFVNENPVAVPHLSWVAADAPAGVATARLLPAHPAFGGAFGA